MSKTHFHDGHTHTHLYTHTYTLAFIKRSLAWLAYLMNSFLNACMQPLHLAQKTNKMEKKHTQILIQLIQSANHGNYSKNSWMIMKEFVNSSKLYDYIILISCCAQRFIITFFALIKKILFVIYSRCNTRIVFICIKYSNNWRLMFLV